MRLLLDTHAIFWTLIEEAQLSARAVEAVRKVDNEVYVSVASAWEMAIKVGQKKWPEAAPLVDSFESQIDAAGLRLLPITIAHVRAAGFMAGTHRDPFDRLLAAQATIEGLTVVTFDAKVRALGAPWLW